MVIAGFIVTALICFGIPIVGIRILGRQKAGCLKAFLLGMLAFFISQICIRIPVLTMVLPEFTWFHIMQLNPWLYGLFLGVTAALFEEIARWLFMRYALCGRKEKRTHDFSGGSRYGLQDGMAFGLGHGGTEAILLVGINAAATLVLGISGAYPLETVLASDIWVAGIERVSAMAFHVGASLLVMYGLRVKKSGRYLLLAIVLHTLMDAAIVILPAVFLVGITGLEIWCAIFGMAALTAGLFLYRRDWKQTRQMV